MKPGDKVRSRFNGKVYTVRRAVANDIELFEIDYNRWYAASWFEVVPEPEPVRIPEPVRSPVWEETWTQSDYGNVLRDDGSVVVYGDELDGGGTGRLIALAPEMARMLIKLEWDNAWDECCVCGAFEDDGHYEDCELAALLKAVRGE